MDFKSELLSRLEAAQLGSPPLMHGVLARSTHQHAAEGASESPGPPALARRILWPQAGGSDSGCAGGCSPSSGSGLPSPRSSAGLLEALLTSDGSPQAAATARAAACAARAAISRRGGSSGAAIPGCWQELPADVWRWVVGGLSPADIKAARLACADWHAALSRNVQLLRPRELRCRQVAARWVDGGWDRARAWHLARRGCGTLRPPHSPPVAQCPLRADVPALPLSHLSKLQLPSRPVPGAGKLSAPPGAS